MYDIPYVVKNCLIFVFLVYADSSVKISISTASVCKYSVWEGPTLNGCGLVKDNNVPPPTLLLLWLSDAQAQKLHTDLSVIESDTRPGQIINLFVDYCIVIIF